jgi:acyl-CoA synthetase (AMP-forming)/AMP-acid ligase II
MLFPKYNAKQIEQHNQVIQQVASKFPRISMSLLWLYPYYKITESSYKDTMIMLDGTTLLFQQWSFVESKEEQIVCYNGNDYRFFVDKQYVMTKDTDYSGEYPTQTEFGCFCLQNNIDISKVKLYDELEVNNQLLMFAKSVGIPEDILESWRL